MSKVDVRRLDMKILLAHGEVLEGARTNCVEDCRSFFSGGKWGRRALADRSNL
jgi:hypothetical protein